ncbi:GlsB/YeaQ/YmgE family stress response membrane protein [Aliisedimentitalea scapharcae]|uniref:GlsB/YeaQ/YmgE family stress response membrane protein n=1 Tax=Aliisedimentitalea scapharcae TaxID=1524259 RepID=A0ABZ2XPJ0_9RHOB
MEEVVSNGPGLFAGFILIAVVGAIIGWLASVIVKGSRFGLWGNMLIGFGGSAIGSNLLPALGLSMGGGIFGVLVTSVIGAVVLLVLYLWRWK